MGFEALLGNEQLKADLTAARRKGRLSHFYLISGPEGSGKHTLADLLAAAMLCREEDAPCGVCKSCRKVLSHTHPDDITIDDPDHKILPVRLIREARADIFVRPNEADKKVYRFPRGQDLNIEGQNALLKVLEEPPEYGVFLLLTDNPEKLLPTVRSRCVELKLRALPEPVLKSALCREFPDADQGELDAAVLRSGGYLGQAKEILSGTGFSEQTVRFAQCYAGRNALELLQTLVPMEKWKRDTLIPELTAWLELLEQAMLVRSGLPGGSKEAAAIAASRSPAELMGAVTALKKSIDYARGNVSCAAVCAWLQWALR